MITGGEKGTCCALVAGEWRERGELLTKVLFHSLHLISFSRSSSCVVSSRRRSRQLSLSRARPLPLPLMAAMRLSQTRFCSFSLLLLPRVIALSLLPFISFARIVVASPATQLHTAYMCTQPSERLVYSLSLSLASPLTLNNRLVAVHLFAHSEKSIIVLKAIVVVPIE